MAPGTTYSSRRSFLKALGSVSAFTIVGTPLLGARPITAYALQGGADTVLINVFLRGGADGLGMVAPFGDDALYARRPTLARPVSELHDLDGFFGLHPAFGALMPAFDDGHLAFVHAVGPAESNRSHFQAMPVIDSALGAGGWLQRAILAGALGLNSAGLSIGSQIKPSLIGPAFGRVVSSLESAIEVSIALAEVKTSLANMYANAPYTMDQTAVLGSLASIGQISAITPTTGTYPEGYPSFLFREAASMIKADIGVRAIAIDIGGWDTHSGQETAWADVAVGLARALAAFQVDLGSHASRVMTVTTSEFGRTVNENGSAGTDHGRGSVMMALGEPLASVGGGQVHVAGGWPGLGIGDLDPAGDLKVTTDFRSVLGELVGQHLGVTDFASVFPGFSPTPVGLLAADQALGDVDQSGTVDAADATAVLTSVVGEPADGIDVAAGDLDGDGDTDVRDALMLAQQLAD